jgi:hypothetical protein
MKKCPHLTTPCEDEIFIYLSYNFLSFHPPMYFLNTDLNICPVILKDVSRDFSVMFSFILILFIIHNLKPFRT